MKTFRNIFVLFLSTLLLFGAGYPLLIYVIGLAVPQQAAGLPLMRDGQLVGFENIGQPFDEPQYFHGRPSAVDYNAAATGGSNKGPTNPEFLTTVQERIAQVRQDNPGVATADIRVEMVTASSSGLDPHISVQASMLQIPRIAKARDIAASQLEALVAQHTETPWLGLFGPGNQVNVLKLNLALDTLK